MLIRKLLIALMITSSFAFTQGFATDMESTIEILENAEECVKCLDGTNTN